MGVLLGLMLASALTQAKPIGNPGQWLSDADYPPGPRRRREEGMVSFDVLISPEGHVETCNITQSSGFPEMDQITCVAVRARAKFKPATDENGIATYSNYNARISWLHPDRSSPPRRSPPFEPPIDMELHVQKLPNGAQEERVAIVTRIDPAGHVAVCEPSQFVKSSPKLVEVACAQAKAIYAFAQTDGNGKAVPIIKSMRILFKVAPK
ncbi:energy transducer TonB [Sphingobium sp. C100]|jgi:TonB family protein|uniref:energy transducer TonB n=1 Tax=Sphingobium sp. C100 TaxID=1207055 RepID=UPI0004CF176E|nr:energy transducer TonB [Sphingobium sp. C100]